MGDMIEGPCPWCGSAAAPYVVDQVDDEGEPALAFICPGCEQERAWASPGFFS